MHFPPRCQRPVFVRGSRPSPKCLSYTRCRSRMDHSCISSEILSTNQPHGILNIFGDTGSLNRPPACTRWKNRGHGTVNHSTVILIRPHDKEHPSGLANSISLACKHTDVGEAYTCRAYRFCHLLNASISDIWKEKEMWMCPEPRVLSQPDSRTQKKKTHNVVTTAKPDPLVPFHVFHDQSCATFFPIFNDNIPNNHRQIQHSYL